MSFKSCGICGGYLNAIILSSTMVFECNHCGKRYKSNENDSLRLEEKFNNNDEDINLYRKFIKNAPYDYANTKRYNQCPKCKNHITTEIVIGKNKKYINICVCGEIF